MRADAKKRNRKRVPSASQVRDGSGSVFADLGVPDSAEALAKADIAIQIAFAIKSRRLTQVEAAVMLGVDQADVSDLIRGKLKGFSTDRLLRFLSALGQDVEIVIHGTPRIRRAGRIRVRRHSPQPVFGGKKR